MVKSSFRITGLVKKLDGSEDYLFEGFKNLREEIVVGIDKDIFNNEIDDIFEDFIF